MYRTLHIGNEILQQLKVQERSVAWLARKIYCDPSNLCKQLKGEHLHTELLYRISIALEKDFFSLYSQQISEKTQGKNNHKDK
jgi:hypothetical protein